MKIIDNVEYYTVSEVAEILNVKQQALYYLINKNEVWSKGSKVRVLPDPKLIGKREYYNKTDILMFKRVVTKVKNNKYKDAYDLAKEEIMLEKINHLNGGGVYA